MQAAQEAMNETQKQIMEWQSNIIDDEHVSDKTTYSSKKIEEFIDPTELEEAVSDIEAGDYNSITDDDIGHLFS